MTADVLEELYTELHLKSDGVPLYIQGWTLKRMAAVLEKEVTQTSDGKPIMDDELYCVGELGTWLIE